jgi:hypothetical protein
MRTRVSPALPVVMDFTPENVPGWYGKTKRGAATGRIVPSLPIRIVYCPR